MPTPTAEPLIAPITGFFSRVDLQRRARPSIAVRVDRLLRALRAAVEGLAAAAEIGAGAEGASFAGHDDDAHVVVGVGCVERVQQLVAHPGRERVHAFGAVQRDRGDAVLHRVANVLVAHPKLLFVPAGPFTAAASSCSRAPITDA